MASPHAIAEPLVDVKKAAEMVIAPVLKLKEAIESVTPPILKPHRVPKVIPVPVRRPRDTRPELIKVLDRAATDPAFMARLSEKGSLALREYDLSLEEQAALVSGDIGWIERRVGKLDDHLSTWLYCRLQQESW